MRCAVLALTTLAAAAGCSDDGSEPVGGGGVDTAVDTGPTLGDGSSTGAEDTTTPPDTGPADSVEPPDAADTADTPPPTDPGPPPPPCVVGAPCDDGQPCTQDDLCADDGTCVGAPYACDDGRPCTDDTCDGAGDCAFTVSAGACLIANVCYAPGDHCLDGVCVPSLIPVVCDDDQPCTNDVCASGSGGCIHVPISGACTDGSACTADDFCEKGKCVPGPFLDCDDGNACTVDLCDPFIGCDYELVDSACCVSGVSLCDDQSPCTTDLCDEDQGTCAHLVNTAPCEDGDACTGPDYCNALTCSGPSLDCDDNNACTTDSCDSALGGCQHTNLPGGCDDGSACTNSDKCVGGTCIGAPVACNDSNGCTQDSCDPALGCTYVPLTGECSDSNVCTTGDTCQSGLCIGTAKVCSDGNQCTNDSCHPALGCQHQNVAGPCDDSLDCSVGDLCQSGVCTADTSACGCIPEFDNVVTKLTLLNIGKDGQPGSGLDVDGDPATCSPAGKCSAGIDNQLAGFAALANDPLTDAFQGGDVILLFEHHGFKSNGQTYLMNFWPAKEVSGVVCDVQTEVCPYNVEAEGIDPETCLSMVSFDNTKIIGDQLTAGGKGYAFPLELPLSDAKLPVTLSNAELHATVTIVGGKVVAMAGVLAGALPKEAFLEGIDSLEEKDLPPGLTKEALKQLISLLITNDIDTNNDGAPDAASIGLSFTGIGANIVGLKN